MTKWTSQIARPYLRELTSRRMSHLPFSSAVRAVGRARERASDPDISCAKRSAKERHQRPRYFTRSDRLKGARYEELALPGIRRNLDARHSFPTLDHFLFLLFLLATRDRNVAMCLTCAFEAIHLHLKDYVLIIFISAMRYSIFYKKTS